MTCATGQKLWPSMRGDTQRMYLEFLTLQGKPIPITGKIIHFTMKTNTMDPDCHYYDLHYRMTVPNDLNASRGRAIMIIPQSLTARLLPNRTYFYDFQLVDDQCVDEPEIDTVGFGEKEITRDVTTGDCDVEEGKPCIA